MLVSAILLLCAGILESCKVFSANTIAMVTDPVCGMKVEKGEAFTYKYKSEKYYFCSYNCKETFKMNPEKILTKNCDDKK